MTALDPSFKYWAFISYSHRDSEYARWLHRALERFRVPASIIEKSAPSNPIPRRLRPIFLDRDELPASSDLGAHVRTALSQSRSLIVVCSPNSARSEWVNEEILTFQRLGRADRVFPVIASGDPSSGADQQAACFPPALEGACTANEAMTGGVIEPLAADARGGRGARRDAVLKVIAGLIGVGFDDLRQRDWLDRRRRIAAWAAALLLVLVGSGLVARHYLVQQHRINVAAELRDMKIRGPVDLVHWAERVHIGIEEARFEGRPIPADEIDRAVEWLAVMEWDPNTTDDNGETVLSFLARQGRPESVRALLDAGADPSRGDWRELSAAVLAKAPENFFLILAKGPPEEALRKAFQKGAAAGRIDVVNALSGRLDGDAQGEALIAAADRGQIESVRLLLQSGVNPNATADGGRTPLMAAVSNGSLEIVDALLAAGADVNVRREDGDSALFSLLNRQSPEGDDAGIALLERLLSSGADPNAACDCPGWRGGSWTVLTYAVERDASPEMLRSLLKAGADPNRPRGGDDASTALIMAAEDGQGQTVGILLEAGARVNDTDANGRSALMLASANTRPGQRPSAVVRQLLDHGADAGLATEAGSTALMFAAGRLGGSTEVVELLLERGAEVQARNELGCSALAAAATSCSPAIVRVLLKAGARIDDVDSRGRTPLMHVLAPIEACQYGGDWYDEQAHAECKLEAVETLLDAGARIDVRDRDGLSPLDVALNQGLNEVVRRLRRPANVRGR